jgi:hypothetical protein
MEGGFESWINSTYGGQTAHSLIPTQAVLDQRHGAGTQIIAGDNGNYYVTSPTAGIGDSWYKYGNDGTFSHQGAHKDAAWADLAAMAALSGVGMSFLGGGLAGGAGVGGAGATGSVSTGAGSFFPMSGTAGAGMSSAAGGGGLFGGLGLGGSGGGMFGSLGGLLGGGGGGWGSLLSGGLNLAGSLIQGNAAKDAANSYAQAATSAANAAKFRPVGVTTRFGNSNFQFDGNGNLVGAGYGLSPDMANMRDRALFQANQGLGTAEGMAGHANSLFGLGAQYTATSPEQAAQDWMASQQSLLAPSRDRELAKVRNGLFNTGRSGLAVGATGARPDGSAGLAAANPEMEAYFNAIAQQDAQLATQADAYGRDRVKFGAGLFGTGLGLMSDAYNPMKAALGLGSTIEDLGQGSMKLGMNLGGLTAQSNSDAAKYLLSGAAQQQAVNSQSPFGAWLTGGAGSSLLNGLFSGGSPAPNYAANLPVGMFRWDE